MVILVRVSEQSGSLKRMREGEKDCRFTDATTPTH